MRHLEQALRWIAIGGIFLLPFIVFIVTSSLFFPFITGKNFFFRIVVEIMTASWLALALISSEYRPRRSWLLGAFALFVAVMAIADAHGVMPFKSFWSNFERMDGWVTLAHLFCYTVVAASMLTTERLWKALMHTMLGVSVLVSGYGLLQLAGMATINQGGVRLDATFGNATYLAVYMLFMIFIAAFLLADAWVARAPGRRTGIVLAYGAVIALDFMILFFTATRGALLGLIGGAMLAALLMTVQAPRSRNAWRVLVGLGVVLVLAAGFWAFRDAAWVKNVEALNRLATISLSDTTTAARFMNMGMALKGFEERPILGWGQENYAIVFDKYYDPNMWPNEPWFDRVHNIVFDWLVAGGVLGLLGYLSLYAFALLGLWQGNTFTRSERSIMTGLLAGYFFYLLFTFDNVTSYILFGTVLAFIAWRVAQERTSLPIVVHTFPKEYLWVTTGIAVVLAWGAAWSINADALAQNRTLLQAIAPQGDLAKNHAYFAQAANNGSFGTQEVREQLIQAAASMAPNTSIPNETKKQFFELAAMQMLAQMQASPLDARFPLFLGMLLDSYGDYANARTALARARELSPAKQSIIFQQAATEAALGNNEQSLAFFKHAFELAPAYADARVLYGRALMDAHQDARAKEILAPITTP